MWSLLNGLNLHKLEPVTDSEVTALACVHGGKMLAVGWSQRLAQYDITEAKVTSGGVISNPQVFHNAVVRLLY